MLSRYQSKKSSENSSEKHEIRSKARTAVTTKSTPYVSPTASSIVTEIDSGYDYSLGDKTNPSTRVGNSTYVDVIKVASAYTRTNTQNLINSSNIRYIDKNEDRVSDWLKVNRLQLPLPSTKSNSVNNNISQSAENVNTPSEKHEIMSKARITDNLGNELTDAQSEYFKDSKGNLMRTFSTRCVQGSRSKDGIKNAPRK